jgi:hypothetical protein
MEWTIRLELTPDGNPPITYHNGTVTRPVADLSPEELAAPKNVRPGNSETER